MRFSGFGRQVMTALVGAIALGITGCITTKTPEAAPAPEMTKVTPELRALAERAERAIVESKGTPGQEYAGRLNQPRLQKIIKALLENDEVPKKTLVPWYMRDLRGSLDRAKMGQQWPAGPNVSVPYATGGIVADGKLNDAAWKKAVTFTGVYAFNTKERLEAPATTWKLLWDERHLYVAYDCVDTDLVAPVLDRDEAVYGDDCVEIFLLPDFRFRTYWELIVSPSGSIYDSIQCKNVDQWGSNHDASLKIEGLKTGIEVRGTLNQPGDEDGGYTVELAIPFDQVPGYTRLAPQAGEKLHFMLARLDRQGEKFVPYAFVPLMAWGHNIWNHAVMELKK